VGLAVLGGVVGGGVVLVELVGGGVVGGGVVVGEVVGEGVGDGVQFQLQVFARTGPPTNIMPAIITATARARFIVPSFRSPASSRWTEVGVRHRPHRRDDPESFASLPEVEMLTLIV